MELVYHIHIEVRVDGADHNDGIITRHERRVKRTIDGAGGWGRVNNVPDVLVVKFPSAAVSSPRDMFVHGAAAVWPDEPGARSRKSG